VTTDISPLRLAEDIPTTGDRTVRDDQEARRARDIVSLLNRHDELRGVHAMADFIDDAVRWTA